MNAVRPIGLFEGHGVALERPRDVKAHVAAALTRLAPFVEGSRFWTHQKEAIGALRLHFADPRRAPRGYVVIPTGGGKTAIFTWLVDAVTRHRASVGSGPTPRTVILVPNLILVSQALMEFRKRHRDVDVGYLASKRLVDREGYAYERGVSTVTVLTYARFSRLVDAGILSPSDVDVLVMDEAHRGLSALRQDAIRSFDRTAVVALSATPAFDEDRSLGTFLGEENLVYSADAQRLRDEGVLAPVANYVMAVKLQGTMPEAIGLRLEVKRKAHVDEILSFLEGHVDGPTGLRLRDKVTIFYGSDTRHAAMFAEAYNERLGPYGKSMAVLTGKDTSERVAEVIRAVNDGTLTGIANAQLLTEGFDLKKVGLIVNSPSDSVVKIVQQSGRAQRMDDALPLDDVGQTAFVLDTYFEVDGEMEGNPQWFFESIEGVPTSFVERDAVDVGALATGNLDGWFDPVEGQEAGSDDPDDGDGDGPQGWEWTPPERYFTGPPPQGFEGLEGGGGRRRRRETPFRVSSAIQTVEYLLRKRTLSRKLPEKGPDWLSKSELISASSKPEIHAFFRSVEEEFRGKRDALTLDDSPVTRQWTDGQWTSAPVALRMDMRRSGFRPTVCYHRESVPDLLRVSGAPMPGEECGREWLSRADFARSLSATDESFVSDFIADLLDTQRGDRSDVRGVGEALDSALADFLLDERLYPEVGGVGTGGGFLRMRRARSKGTTYVAYHRDDVDVLRRAVGMDCEAKPANELTRAQFASAAGVGPASPALVTAFEAFARQIEGGAPTEVDGVAIAVRMRYAGGNRTPCVAASDADRLAEALGIGRTPGRGEADAADVGSPSPFRERQQGWLTFPEATLFLDAVASDRRLVAVWDVLERALDEPAGPTAEGRPFLMERMLVRGRARCCVHESEIGTLSDLAGLGAFARDADGRTSRAPGEEGSVRSEAGEAPEEPASPARAPGWLDKPAVAARLGASSTSKSFATVWEGMMLDREAGTPAVVSGREVRFDRVASGTRTPYCLHEGDLDVLADALKVPDRAT